MIVTCNRQKRKPAMNTAAAQYDSKQAAIRAARQLRAAGQSVKVYHHAGIYTVPFQGITSYSYYTVS